MKMLQIFFRPDDVFTITSTSRDTFDFNNIEDSEPRKSTDTAREFNGEQLGHLDLVMSLKTKHTLQQM